MKLTKEELLEILNNNRDMLIAFINFNDAAGHLVDIGTLCINGNAVQIEVKPLD